MTALRKNDLCLTPDQEVAFVRSVLGQIDLDPCASSEAYTETDEGKVWTRATGLGETNYTLEQDGTTSIWFGRVFFNPPYSQLLTWTALAARWWERRGVASLGLLPVNTATEWWQDNVGRATVATLLRKRVAHKDPTSGELCTSTRHDSCYVLWGPDDLAQSLVDRTAESNRGMVVVPARAAIADAMKQLDILVERV